MKQRKWLGLWHRHTWKFKWVKGVVVYYPMVECDCGKDKHISTARSNRKITIKDIELIKAIARNVS